MTNYETNYTPASEPAAGDAGTAEFKRQAARRCFLADSAAAGIGTVIVTFHHKRTSVADRTTMFSWAAARSHSGPRDAVTAHDVAH